MHQEPSHRAERQRENLAQHIECAANYAGIFAGGYFSRSGSLDRHRISRAPILILHCFSSLISRNREPSLEVGTTPE